MISSPTYMRRSFANWRARAIAVMLGRLSSVGEQKAKI